MNIEVMRVIDTSALFSLGSRQERLAFPPSHASRCQKLPLSSSYVEFVASFILSNPPTKTIPWNTNILSFVKHVVDELSLEDGLRSDDKRREVLVRRFCHHLFEMKHWKQQPYWFSELVNPNPDFSDTTETSEFNVILANIILGRRTTLHDLEVASLVRRKSSILGTLMEASVKSGQIDLVKYLLDSDCVSINDQNHSVLEMAAECVDAEMLRTLFMPKYGIAYSEDRLKKCIMQAIENDRTETALYLLRREDHRALAQKLCHYPFEAACNRGNLTILKALVDELDFDLKNSVRGAYENYHLQCVAYYGHEHVLRYFFEKGVEREPLTMRAAGMRADISLARFLRDQGVCPSAQNWASVLRVATDHATPRHFAWTRAIFEESFVTPEALLHSSVTLCDLVQSACMHGNVDLIRTLVTAGLDINNVMFLEDTPPVYMAKAAAHPDMVSALVAMGAKPIDPLETKHAELFKTGVFPKTWKRRITYGNGATHWYDKFSE